MAAAIIAACGSIAVGGLSLAGVIIQVKAKARAESIDTKLEHIRGEFTGITDKFALELKEFKEESKQADAVLMERMTKGEYRIIKTYLVNELNKILNEAYVPCEEQKKMLKEAYDAYVDSGGNSYVKDMYEEAKRKGLI